jgi:ribosomal protein S12 methylthiotransferase
MGKPRFHVVSLGCAKNTVDSESMAALLQTAGYLADSDPARADVLIVNTCGFIGPAKEESLRVLREFSEAKHPGQLLLAAGCLTQRYGAEVIAQAPGVDGVLGTRRWADVVEVVRALRHGTSPTPIYHLPESGPVVMESPGIPRWAVQGASAYLKIADGCRRPCAFCAIPLIKGTAVSRAPEAILREAAELDRRGVHEINLIAQDTTDYGWDLGLKDGLPILLEGLLVAAPSIDWFRILYAYPGYVTDRLIDTMAANPRLIPYLDMPLQHAHPDTLRRMRRPANIDWVHRTIEKMRRQLPDLALRTTFLVGYPGETEREFKTLLDFVAEMRFDRLGAFTFSFEPGTSSEPLGDPVPTEVKEERRDRLMALQQTISLQKNQAMVGRTLQVLIEGQGDGLSLGRSYRDAPEIDGLVIVEGAAPIGAMVPVRITGALMYDLSGTVARPS